MKSTPSAERAPFPVENFGKRVGHGKDNMVRAFPVLGNEGGLVIKVNHDKGPRSNEEVRRAIQYKREKYEILRLFLGDFIPESGFVLGHKTDQDRVRAVEYVVQQRLPDRHLASLTSEQLQDPRLVRNMQLLMIKLENLYRAMGYINARTGGVGASLDAKLDLGGISGYVREHIEEEFSYKAAQTALAKKKRTKNLLVDPDTMDIYCVDFDEGEWTQDKAEAKAMLFDLVEARPDLQNTIRLEASDLVELEPNTNGSGLAA